MGTDDKRWTDEDMRRLVRMAVEESGGRRHRVRTRQVGTNMTEAEYARFLSYATEMHRGVPLATVARVILLERTEQWENEVSSPAAPSSSDLQIPEPRATRSIPSKPAKKTRGV